MSHGFARIRHELTCRISDRCAQQLELISGPSSSAPANVLVAAVDGNRSKNINKTGVRLGTIPQLIEPQSKSGHQYGVTRD
jgi:hypothetical protein